MPFTPIQFSQLSIFNFLQYKTTNESRTMTEFLTFLGKCSRLVKRGFRLRRSRWQVMRYDSQYKRNALLCTGAFSVYSDSPRRPYNRRNSLSFALSLSSDFWSISNGAMLAHRRRSGDLFQDNSFEDWQKQKTMTTEPHHNYFTGENLSQDPMSNQSVFWYNGAMKKLKKDNRHWNAKTLESVASRC